MSENRKLKIIVDDVEYESFSTPAFDKKQKWTKPNDKIINSIIPGTIIEVFVKKGDKVKEGDAMLIIEAMKMNNKINFFKDGIVDEVLVKSGDIVAKNQNLIILK
ncbi:MAG: acetyl-CoA carboxylase biotin carboxyl carrier protein subunit [Bacteroidales bacterium]|nr:acetyl-CoA carboxylase biotin carboxyl carrier protein subunit [Bacteroidales bacterium]MCK9498042.1 acetyl-CoA carboxylase biotin carboxyl carrier protein subunit [Bacteroidales bacterium]MDY0314232.1 acetyl-CoA carboxylase biotin carboxyl carrier protein subunit [Bacteroidales bacterium]NLB85435.1 acetyl-CoA carboxylase biotin carboxyl carrier protein subunit [Bacteroidales bacterium]